VIVNDEIRARINDEKKRNIHIKVVGSIEVRIWEKQVRMIRARSNFINVCSLIKL